MEENNELLEENLDQEKIEQENLDQELNQEEIVQNEQNITVEQSGSEEQTGQNAQTENIVPKIILEDIEEDSTEVIEESSEEIQDTLEEVILKYFNKKGDISEEQNSSLLEEGSSSGEEAEETETTDYTELLEKIYDNTKESLENIETQTKSISDYNENNTLQSSIEDISLTNVLLLTLIVIMMFNGLLEFTRRIF